MKYEKFFRNGKGETVRSRESTIRRAVFKNMIPWNTPTDKEIEESLEKLKMNKNDIRCVYCGEKATTLDHINSLVENKKPTGYINEIANLVPCCQSCNSSRGNKYWKDWMLNSNTEKSPKGRNIPNLEAKAKNIEDYINDMNPQKISIKDLLGEKKYNETMGLMEEVITLLVRLDDMCKENRKIIEKKLKYK